ncbi:MAG: hypothetical protein AAB221_00560, partial [Bacteroidota bacterium]
SYLVAVVSIFAAAVSGVAVAAVSGVVTAAVSGALAAVSSPPVFLSDLLLQATIVAAMNAIASTFFIFEILDCLLKYFAVYSQKRKR